MQLVNREAFFGRRIEIDSANHTLSLILLCSKQCRRAIARAGGPDVAAKIWDVIEKKRE